MKLVKLVHNHPDSSGFGGFLTDFLWTLATIFFFQNSLGLPYLYQSLNTNGFFFIRIQSGDNTSINNSNADLNFLGGLSGNVARRHVYGPKEAKPYIEEDEGVLDSMWVWGGAMSIHNI